jgi:transposase
VVEAFGEPVVLGASFGSLIVLDCLVLQQDSDCTGDESTAECSFFVGVHATSSMSYVRFGFPFFLANSTEQQMHHASGAFGGGLRTK